MRIASNPLVAWYTSLPVDHQTDIAHLVSYIWPDHPLAGRANNEDVHTKFAAWIMASSTDEFKAVGVSLALIKIIEFVFINQRGSHEDWDLTLNRIERMRDGIKARGNDELARKIEQIMLELPDRSAAWIATSNSWTKLRQSTLSDDALHSCLRPGAA